MIEIQVSVCVCMWLKDISSDGGIWNSPHSYYKEDPNVIKEVNM